MTDNLLTAEITGTSEQSNEAATSASDKPTHVPEKFWDAEAKSIRTDALLQSYLALEKKMSRMIPLPECENDKRRLQKILGAPDKPEDYQVTLTNDIIPLDTELNARLHAKGFTNEQVQEIYDLATEKLVPLVLEMAAEFQADLEIERLVKEFGGTEKWNVISTQLQEFGKKNLPASAYEGLCCSYDGVMALYQMMKSKSVSPFNNEKDSAFETLDEKGLRTMMQNPKYWRERDPAYIAKVSEGFQKLYAGERD